METKTSLKQNEGVGYAVIYVFALILLSQCIRFWWLTSSVLLFIAFIHKNKYVKTACVIFALLFVHYGNMIVFSESEIVEFRQSLVTDLADDLYDETYDRARERILEQTDGFLKKWRVSSKLFFAKKPIKIVCKPKLYNIINSALAAPIASDFAAMEGKKYKFLIKRSITKKYKAIILNSEIENLAAEFFVEAYNCWISEEGREKQLPPIRPNEDSEDPPAHEEDEAVAYGSAEQNGGTAETVEPAVSSVEAPSSEPADGGAGSGSEQAASAADVPASLRAVYADKQAGEHFELGRYPQGPNGEVKPISWRVLRRDSDSLLVISEYGLDAKPYHKDKGEITWSECSLRSWLNGDFLHKAFTEEERSAIKTSCLDNNAGPATDDQIFLLSVDEAKSLFNNKADRTVKLDAYAIKKGADNDNGNGWWWLRSRGENVHNAAASDYDGSLSSYGLHVYVSSGCVRPAFRIAL